MLPKVSVIVPVLNRENLIVRCLDSVLNQTVKPFEIIIVDNGSEDNTKNVVKSWISKNKEKGLDIFLLEENRRGVCFARQKGLEKTRGDYVYFFDSDDVMYPQLLYIVSEKLRENSRTDIVCWKCRINLLDGSKKIPHFDTTNSFENHLIHTLLRTQGYLVKKSLLMEVGGWNKYLPVWNDLELGVRLLLNEPVLAEIKDVMVEIYSQEESITGKDFSSKEGKWEKSLEEIKRDIQVSDFGDKDLLNRIINYRKAILAAHYYRESNKKGAKRLLMETLNEKNRYEKFLLKFSYLYTRLGFRGAWHLIRYAYRFK